MDAKEPQQNSDELQNRLQALAEENLQLHDKNERLSAKVGYLENRLGHLSSSNTDLSSRLVHSEEAKLNLSKELVDEKIQNNKIREQFAEEMFELKNKMWNQDGIITKLEMERDGLFRELQSDKARPKLGETSGLDLAEDHSKLKENYQALVEAHNKQLALEEELGAELLKLAQEQDALRRQLGEQQDSVKTTTRGLHSELGRVRDLISRLSSNRVQLLGNQDEIKDMLEKMRNSHEEQQSTLEEKVAALGKEQREDKRAIRNSQQQLSEQSAAMMFAQSQVKEVEEENSKLQLQVKELNDEYRARLVCYLRDLAVYFDGLGEGQSPPQASKMREFVDSMLQDVRSSHRVREEQLASAARTYKKRLQKVTKTHHAFLLSYRVQREKSVATSDNSVHGGLPAASSSPEQSELIDETEKDREGQLQAAWEQVSVLKMPIQNLNHQTSEQIREAFWTDIKKQLSEVTRSTLAGLEKERALLITKATVAEARVAQMQEYIDNHLGRYKEEVSRLRRLHGKQEAGRSQSAHSSHP